MALPIPSICVFLFPHPLKVDHSAPHTTATATACWPATGATPWFLHAAVIWTIDMGACCTSASTTSSNAQQHQQQQQLASRCLATDLCSVSTVKKQTGPKHLLCSRSFCCWTQLNPAMQCNAMQFDVTQRNATQRNAMQCNAMPCNAAQTQSRSTQVCFHSMESTTKSCYLIVQTQCSFTQAALHAYTSCLSMLMPGTSCHPIAALTTSDGQRRCALHHNKHSPKLSAGEWNRHAETLVYLMRWQQC